MVQVQQRSGMRPEMSPVSNSAGPLESIGFGALLFFVFSVSSSAIDLIPGVRSIRPSLLAAIVGLAVIGITGQAGRILSNNIAKSFVALTIWFIICVPFGVWPGGAVTTLAGPWAVVFLTLFMMGGLMPTPSHCLKISHTLGYSTIILAIIALVRNQQSIENRLMLAGSRYGNPNDLALMGLAALPFLVFMSMRRGNGLRRPLGLIGLFPVLFMIAKTASRAAGMGAIVALLTVFLHVGVAQKIKVLATALVACSILMAVLPSHITRRFVTVFGDTDTSVQMDELTMATIGSAEARRMLLLDSITITFQRPVFGVGPGNFPVEQDTLARARGERMGDWHVTHNTYTQFSSESGLPGLLFFLLAIFFCFRSLTRTIRAAAQSDVPEVRDLAAIALCLRVALMAYLTVAFFDSLAYSPTLTLFTGMAISLEYCAFKQAAMPRPSAVHGFAWQVPVPRPVKPELRRPVRDNPGSAIRTKSRS